MSETGKRAMYRPARKVWNDQPPGMRRAREGGSGRTLRRALRASAGVIVWSVVCESAAYRSLLWLTIVSRHDRLEAASRSLAVAALIRWLSRKAEAARRDDVAVYLAGAAGDGVAGAGEG